MRESRRKVSRVHVCIERDEGSCICGTNGTKCDYIWGFPLQPNYLRWAENRMSENNSNADECIRWMLCAICATNLIRAGLSEWEPVKLYIWHIDDIADHVIMEQILDGNGNYSVCVVRIVALHTCISNDKLAFKWLLPFRPFNMCEIALLTVLYPSRSLFRLFYHFSHLVVGEWLLRAEIGVRIENVYFIHTDNLTSIYSHRNESDEHQRF